MHVSVLGSGRWGSFLGWYCSNLGYRVTLWGRENSRSLLDLARTRKNRFVSLPIDVRLTTSLDEAVASADICLVAISAQYLRSLCEDIVHTDYHGKVFSLNMKGLEARTGKRLTQIMHEIFGTRVQTVVWVGPGHVQDLVAGIPNCMVIASSEPRTAKAVMEVFSSSLIRLYSNEDLIGTEVGAAMKNVFGIAAGMLDGLGLPSLKGPLMARGPYEASRLIRLLGGDGKSAYGLAHLGDYEATLFSPHSQNRRFGEAFVKNEEYALLAEGVPTLEAISRIGTSTIELPITSTLQRILKREVSPLAGLNSLFLRPEKGEFDP